MSDPNGGNDGYEGDNMTKEQKKARRERLKDERKANNDERKESDAELTLEEVEAMQAEKERKARGSTWKRCRGGTRLRGPTRTRMKPLLRAQRMWMKKKRTSSNCKCYSTYQHCQHRCFSALKQYIYTIVTKSCHD